VSGQLPAADHADGRLRHIAQAGALQFDPRLLIRRCGNCGEPGVLVEGWCPPCRYRAGLPVPRFLLPRERAYSTPEAETR
jgi:hypothetical protein